MYVCGTMTLASNKLPGAPMNAALPLRLVMLQSDMVDTCIYVCLYVVVVVVYV